MKKILLFTVFFQALQATGQGPVQKIATSYYRSTPFNKPFSTFMDHLLNDPSLENKNIRKKTDTTLFYFEGTYTHHNPFFFKPVRTRIILAEKEERLDSAQGYTIVYQYQLLAYAMPGEKGRKEVQEEYNRFCRAQRKHFGESEPQELVANNQRTGEIKHFPLGYVPFYPVTAAWVAGNKEEDRLFAITIRFTVTDNVALLPVFLPIPAEGF